jgi:hypothetical protein
MRSAAGSISKWGVIFMYQMEEGLAGHSGNSPHCESAWEKKAFSFSFTRSHVKQFLVIVLPFTAGLSRWLLPYRCGEVYEPWSSGNASLQGCKLLLYRVHRSASGFGVRLVTWLRKTRHITMDAGGQFFKEMIREHFTRAGDEIQKSWHKSQSKPRLDRTAKEKQVGLNIIGTWRYVSACVRRQSSQREDTTVCSYGMLVWRVNRPYTLPSIASLQPTEERDRE